MHISFGVECSGLGFIYEDNISILTYEDNKPIFLAFIYQDLLYLLSFVLESQIEIPLKDTIPLYFLKT